MNIRNLKKGLLLFSGLFLFIIGIAGLVLPILPGYIFIFAGVTLCAKSSNRIKNKFRLDMIVEKMKFQTPGFVTKNSVEIK